MAAFQDHYYESPMLDAKAAFNSTEDMLDPSFLGMVSPDMSPKGGRRTYSPENAAHFGTESEYLSEGSHQLSVHMPASLGDVQGHAQGVGIASQQWAPQAPMVFPGATEYYGTPQEALAYTGGVMNSLDPMVASMQHRQGYAVPSMEVGSREWACSGRGVPEQSMQSPRLGKHAVSYGRTSSGMRFRGDGIRKKNARFEIPADVNLDTVDRLISEATDDALIKELKQQKRLLRNRQAALDSRLRKKQHTEKLEGDMNRANIKIRELENKLAEAKQQRNATRDELVMVARRNAELQRHIEEIKARHHREIEELKQKNDALHYRADKQARSSAELNFTGVDSSWAGFGTEDTLRIVGSDMHNDFEGINTPSLSPASSPSFSAVDAVSSSKDGVSPFTWDVFCMCLLLGALVASRTDNFMSNGTQSLSENYSKEAKRLISSIVPNSASAIGPIGDLTGDSKIDMFLSLDDRVAEFSSVNRETLQKMFNALRCSLPKAKAVISEQTVRDFKMLLGTGVLPPNLTTTVQL